MTAPRRATDGAPPGPHGRAGRPDSGAMLVAPMLLRLRAARDVDETLQVAMRDVVALHGAERGNLQLFNGSGQLMIVAQSGLSRAFLVNFARVEVDDGTICGRAAALRQTVFIADVEQDEAFAVHRAFARAVPFRSVLSSPLVAEPEGCIGMVSVHSAHPLAPTPLELASLEAYCAELARRLAAFHRPGELREKAEAYAARLMARHDGRG